MVEQCIVCLEPLGVEADPAPLSPEQQEQIRSLQEEHAHLALVDPDALADLNAKSEAANAPEGSDGYVAQIPACGHILHDACLRAWSEKANSCPICRQAFHVVVVYDKIGGKYLNTRSVQEKRQVADFDPRQWADENPEVDEVPSVPCPVCNLADHEEVLLLCDGCDAPYHTHCIGLDSVPRGQWFCMECVHELGPEVIQPAPAGSRLSRPRQSYYFPRTQASMRRARQRARSDEWQGAWGRITGRIWDALNLDLDYEDDDDSDVFEGLQRSRQLREREREEHRRWMQRLNIASRLGAREVFANNLPEFVDVQPAIRQPTPPESRDERRERMAWGAFEKAREAEARKRKSRSATAEPNEEPQQEPERRLKRPRVRRLHTQNGESSSAAREAGPSMSLDNDAHSSVAGPSRPAEAAPSFLSSLLKEVEMSTPSEGSLHHMFGPIPGVHDASSPARSPSPRSQGSVTPPRNRSSSPQMTLSSHIMPVYPPANFSPTRASSSNSTKPSRPTSPHKQTRGAKEGGPSPENSDSEHRGRERGQVRNHQNRHAQMELRQPQPRRTQTAVVLPRSQNVSPARSPLPYELKQSISSIVRSALKPHWRSRELTPVQYETINREISRKIYDGVKDPATVSENTKQDWEKLATQEVARAVASLKA